MSICGEIEISQKELTESLERLSRTSDLLTKIKETLNETVKLHEFAVKSHDIACKRLILLLEVDKQTIPPNDEILQELLEDVN
jgi:hypothetical protein